MKGYLNTLSLIALVLLAGCAAETASRDDVQKNDSYKTEVFTVPYYLLARCVDDVFADVKPVFYRGEQRAIVKGGAGFAPYLGWHLEIEQITRFDTRIQFWSLHTDTGNLQALALWREAVKCGERLSPPAI